MVRQELEFGSLCIGPKAQGGHCQEFIAGSETKLIKGLYYTGVFNPLAGEFCF